MENWSFFTGKVPVSLTFVLQRKLYNALIQSHFDYACSTFKKALNYAK